MGAMPPSPAFSSPPARPAVPLRQDARTIGLVGLAHGSSHFFHLLLPPLFPWLIAEFGFNYSQLGLLVSVFFVVSGVGQALSGFVVDRIGARPVMFASLACFAVAGLLAGMAQGYNGLVLAAALAGLGNAPFHPVDFTILNKRVSPQRLGHGFSVHGISGNLGWATAPVFMAGIASATGSWRAACLCGALLALVVLAVMVWNRDALDDRQGGSHHQPPIALGRARHQPRGRKTRQRKEHDGPRAHPVYQKARQGLAHPGDHKEHGHQHPEFGIAEAELGNQPREQRGQQHVKEVRAAMGQAHQPDGAGVLPKRHGAG